MSNPLNMAPAAPARSAPREEVRIALLEAVGRLIQRFGYKKTSVEEIALEAGVSRATAYLYFASKESLVLEWVEWRGQRRLQNLKAIARDSAAVGRRTVREQIALVLQARILTHYDEALPFLRTVRGVQGIDELRIALREPLLALRERHYESEADLIAGLLEEGKQRGEFTTLADTRSSARLLILGTNSLLPFNLTPQLLENRHEVENLARELIALMLNGFARSISTTDMGEGRVGE